MTPTWLEIFRAVHEARRLHAHDGPDDDRTLEALDAVVALADAHPRGDDLVAVCEVLLDNAGRILALAVFAGATLAYALAT